MKITTSKLIRWAGLSAMGAGIIFLIIQVLHPLDLLSSVTTTRWAIVHYLGVTMCLLGMVGMVGLYARQVEESGWLGLVGYLLFSLFWALSMAFQFIEAFISPVLGVEAPKVVESILGVITGRAGVVNLGALPTVYLLTGFVCYMLGGLLFGIATLRAGLLPRWAGGLLAFAAVLPLASPLLQHPLDRIFAVPMGLALAWLGYALWSDQRAQTAQPVAARGSLQLHQTSAE